MSFKGVSTCFKFWTSVYTGQGQEGRGHRARVKVKGPKGKSRREGDTGKGPQGKGHRTMNTGQGPQGKESILISDNFF